MDSRDTHASGPGHAVQCAPRCAIPASSLDVQLNAPSGCRFGCECAIRARWRNEKCNLILVHALHLHRRVTERLSEEKRGSSMGHGAALLRAQWSHCGGLRDTGPTLFSSTILGGIVYRHVPYRPLLLSAPPRFYLPPLLFSSPPLPTEHNHASLLPAQTAIARLSTAECGAHAARNGCLALSRLPSLKL